MYLRLLVVALLSAVALACTPVEEDSGNTSRGPIFRATTLTGSGPSQSHTFEVPIDSWRACFETSTDGNVGGLIFVNVYRESDDRRVGRLAGDADVGSTSGCTIVRSEPGDHYVDVNTGAGVDWTVRVTR